MEDLCDFTLLLWHFTSVALSQTWAILQETNCYVVVVFKAKKKKKTPPPPNLCTFAVPRLSNNLSSKTFV